MINSDVTPKGMWDAMFANRQNGGTPIMPEAPPTSLSTLAEGGQNHAQKWMSEAANSAASPKVNLANPGTVQPAPDYKKLFSWSSAFKT